MMVSIVMCQVILNRPTFTSNVPTVSIKRDEVTEKIKKGEIVSIYIVNPKKKVLMFCIMSLVFNRRELNSSLLLPSYADAHTHTV